MSASREKKTRKNTAPAPVVKQENVKKGMPTALKRVLGIAAALVLVALVGVSMFFGSDYFYQNSVAVTAGEHELTPAEVNYYFRESYYQASQDSNMSSFLSYMTDMILDDAVESIKETYAVYDAAVAEGYTLTDEDVAELDQELEDMKLTAKTMGASDVDYLLESVYGKGCNLESYRNYREVRMIAARYTTDMSDAQDVSEAALDAYYAEHTEDLDTVSYRQFFMPVQDSMEETKALAQTVLAEVAKNPTSMDQYALEYAEEENLEHYATTKDATLLQNISKAAAAAEVADWLFDSARKARDVVAIEKSDASGLYLVCFDSRNTGDYNTVSVRHILLGSDGADEEVKATAQAYLEEFLNGDKTEESFAALAEEYSEDNADEGGLYENIYKGQMVAPFEDWCFDPARKAGDSGIVETEYGYHIMYFVGEGENYRDLRTKTAILNNFYETWIEGLTADYPVTTDEKAMDYVTTTVSQ